MNIDTKKYGNLYSGSGTVQLYKSCQKLGYSQSTVSFQIRQLEEMLNVRLWSGSIIRSH